MIIYITRRSRHFMGIDVKATGLKLFSRLTQVDFGIGEILEVFQAFGMDLEFNDILKMVVKILASSLGTSFQNT